MMEELIIYSVVGLLCFGIMYIYLRKLKNESDEVTEKIEKAKEEGIHEPVSLYPYINEDNCIKSGACITACPEHDILGIETEELLWSMLPDVLDMELVFMPVL
jgi:thioredoxin reductase (NADPH)